MALPLQMAIAPAPLWLTSMYDPYQEVFNDGVHRCSNAALMLHAVVSSKAVEERVASVDRVLPEAVRNGVCR